MDHYPRTPEEGEQLDRETEEQNAGHVSKGQKETQTLCPTFLWRSASLLF